MLEPWSQSVLWIVVVAFVIAFALAFGLGANDVANSFGTSVGSRVLTLRQACVLASVFELAGAALLGYKVADTVREGIVDVRLFVGGERELMLGSLSALVGSALWSLLATALALPISGTHTVVGATVGFALVARGAGGVRWPALARIVGSWLVSPLLSGAASALLFLAVRAAVLRAERPLPRGLLLLPVLCGATVLVNVLGVLLDGPRLLLLDRLPAWGAIAAAAAVGLLAAAVAQLWLVPRIRRHQDEDGSAQLNGKAATSGGASNAGFAGDEPAGGATDTPSARPTQDHSGGAGPGPTDLTGPTNSDSPSADPDTAAGVAPRNYGTVGSAGADDNVAAAAAPPPAPLQDAAGEAPLFAPLQIMTACFGSLAHGGNDVSNAVGPLAAVWLVYTDGSVARGVETPASVLLFGGVGMVIGLWAWGRRVMRTIGEDLTPLTPAAGFAVELGAASTVLLASKAGLPISTTHCKVGSVVLVGWARAGVGGVSWRLFAGIAAAWLVTVPAAAVASAATVVALQTAAL